MREKRTTKTPNRKQEKVAENKKKLLEKLHSSLGIVSTACESIGISRRTFYNYLEQDKDFAENVKQIEERQIDFVETALLQNIKKGDSSAIIFYLKTKAKHRGYNERVELTGGDGKDLLSNIKIEVIETKQTKD